MNKIVAIIALVAFMFVSCASPKVLEVTNKNTGEKISATIQPYGIANQDQKNPEVSYSVSVGNVIWSVVLVETVVAPIVLLGWFLFEPVGNSVADGVIGAN